MRTRIKSLTLGKQFVLPCIISAASPRKTKAGKDFLNLTVSDGNDSISGNFWDWSGKAVPDIGGTVYTVSGTVTEYLGQKQLTVQGIKTCTEYSLTDFVAQAGVDVSCIYKDAIEFATEHIMDNFLRDLTLKLFEDNVQAWLTIPGAKGVHHAYVGGTLIHCLNVAKIANSMAEHIPFANTSLVVAGALLHDIGKLHTYEFNGAAIEMTEHGKLFDHLFMGASMVERAGMTEMLDAYDSAKLEWLVHIILSHHGSLEHGSVVDTMSVEAVIVSQADNVDAKCETIREACEKTEASWTDKIYTNNNRPVINYKTVQSVMSELERRHYLFSDEASSEPDVEEDDDLPFN